MKLQITISIGIVFLFIFSTIVLFQIDKAKSQSDNLTDSYATDYYSNPSGYVNKQVEFSGKILSSLPSNSSGANTLQMYQAGDTNRNTVVFHTFPIQLFKDDCVRITGISQPPIEYETMFGATLTAAAINADSITKIDCSEAIDPAIKTVNVEQTKESSKTKVTLHKVEFSDKNTRAYLTVENIDPSEDITFYDFNSRAIQGITQFTTTNSYAINYPKIESTIPSGIVEDGVVLFEPLDPYQNEAQFRFEVREGIDELVFTFDIILSTKGVDSPSPTENNSPDVDPTGSVSITIPVGASIPGNTPYDPTELSVKKGENVTVVNNDNAPMTATSGNGFEDAGQAFDTSLIMAGASATIDTSTMEAGEYPYFCTVHPFMKGTLTVTTGDT